MRARTTHTSYTPADHNIARPQGRFHKPGVYFQPTASFRPAENIQKNLVEDGYLPSRVPTALNLLQAFESDPALAGIHPRLSAMRISKIIPTAPIGREMIRPIRNGQRPIFRVLPALIWRIRYSKIPRSVNDMSLMASLDLEVAQFSTFDVGIRELDIALHGGEVQSLAGPADACAIHRPGDQLTYVYNMKPHVANDGALAVTTKGHFLTVSIKAHVFVSETCRPDIAIEWKTPVDFTSEQSSSLMKAAHRLSHPTTQDSKTPNPDALPAHDTQSQHDLDGLNNDISLTLTVTGSSVVQVGKLFTWDVFIVNRSDRTRKLAILVVAKRKRETEKHRSHPSTSSADGLRADKKDLLATAVVDENVIYAKQKSAKQETAELICLTTDIRLGSVSLMRSSRESLLISSRQLSSGSCYTADLKFIALSAGVLSVESVRVIDLATSETADIRDLPSVVAE